MSAVSKAASESSGTDRNCTWKSAVVAALAAEKPDHLRLRKQRFMRFERCVPCPRAELAKTAVCTSLQVQRHDRQRRPARDPFPPRSGSLKLLNITSLAALCSASHPATPRRDTGGRHPCQSKRPWTSSCMGDSTGLREAHGFSSSSPPPSPSLPPLLSLSATGISTNACSTGAENIPTNEKT